MQLLTRYIRIQTEWNRLFGSEGVFILIPTNEQYFGPKKLEPKRV
jgi:hypothetical protein